MNMIDSTPPAVIELPLSSLENLTMELAWRYDELEEMVREMQQEIDRIKALFEEVFPIQN